MPLGDVVHHRLFAVRGLPRLERVYRDGLVPVVRRPHDDRVHVVAGEHLPVVAAREDVAVSLAGRVEAAVEDVAGRHEFDPGDAQRRVHAGHPHPARADHGQADPVGGRNPAGGRLAGEPAGFPANHRAGFARER